MQSLAPIRPGPPLVNDNVLALPGRAAEADVAQRLRCLGTEHEVVGDAVFACGEHDGLARFHGPNGLLQLRGGLHLHHLAFGLGQRCGGFLFE